MNHTKLNFNNQNNNGSQWHQMINSSLHQIKAQIQCKIKIMIISKIR